MTTVLSPKREAQLATTLWPQVDLLPREVRAARKLAGLKRTLGLVLLVLVLLSTLGWVYALSSLRSAKQELAEVQQETVELTAEQQQYAEVPRIKGQVAKIEDALRTSTATEVLWRPYLEALRATTPATVSYDTMQVTLVTDPTANASTDVLQGPSVGQISFTGRATTVPDVSAWMDAIRAIPGLADPWVSQVSVTDDEGITYYQVTGTVQVTAEAWSHRFEPAAETEEGE